MDNIFLSRNRRLAITLLSWLSMLGFDFLLHGGVLAGLYVQSSPFLLPPLRAFQLIPVGYASFLLLAVLLSWLMFRLKLYGARTGFIFGLQIGGLAWGALILGLVSISTAGLDLLAGWFVGQTIELGIGGAVTGAGFAGRTLKWLTWRVIGFVVLCALITVILQSTGLVPTSRF